MMIKNAGESGESALSRFFGFLSFLCKRSILDELHRCNYHRKLLCKFQMAESKNFHFQPFLLWYPANTVHRDLKIIGNYAIMMPVSRIKKKESCHGL